MFSRVHTAIAFIFLFISLASATATTTVTVTTYAPGASPTLASQCNTGSLFCCNAVQASTVGIIGALLSFAQIDVDPITALVGALCTGLAGVGSSCTAQAVCCQNNNFSGVVVIGCTPVNINL